MNIIIEISEALKEILFDWTARVFYVFDVIGIMLYFSAKTEINNNILIALLFSGIFFSSIRIVIIKNRRIDKMKKGDNCPDFILFREIKHKILPVNTIPDFLRNQNFGDSFDFEHVERLDEFWRLCESRPDFVFEDKVLEESRKELCEKTKGFVLLVLENTDDYGGRGWNSVNQNLEIDDPQLFKERVESLQKDAGELFKIYAKFLALGIQRLNITIK